MGKIYELIKCKICGKKFCSITHTHLQKEHNMTLREYMNTFPDAKLHGEEQIKDSKQLLLDEVNKLGRLK